MDAIAGLRIDEFCLEEIQFDFECFNISTMPGNYVSLWALWDTNNDEQISMKEFLEMFDTLDLNMDGKSQPIEQEAYFSRNKYLFYRPYREKTIAEYNLKHEKLNAKQN